MKVWKRCFAAVLAFMIFTTSVNFTEAAGTYDMENFIWTASDGEVAAGYYGLDKEETAVLLNNAVDSGYQYTLFAPYDNETEGKSNLVAVDFENKQVYAKALHTAGYSWLPIEAILSANGEEETIPLTAGICYYNEIEYYANGAFTYSGNSYKVNVIYRLDVDISTEEQTRILEIPMIFAQTANNLEVSLYDIEDDLLDLTAMIPALNEMLSVEYTEIRTEKTEGTDETTDIEVTVPLFDPTEDASLIESIEGMYQEYVENNEKLILGGMREDYFSNYRAHSVTYALEKGAELQKQSETLLEEIYILEDSDLNNKCNNLKNIDEELYTQVKNIRRVLRGLTGTAVKPGELEKLADPANWCILDEEVKERIFSDSYTDEDFAALEAAVYRLRESEYEVPSIESETLMAAEIGVECDITFHEITVTVAAETVTGNLEDASLRSLEPAVTTIKLLEGSTADEIRQAIEEKGIERFALNAWNTLDAEYQIHTRYYDREESGVPKTLNGNVECRIFYSPKTYRVKTNFGKSGNVPYGYKLEFPVSTIEDISYDYVVENQDGTKVSYNEGITYMVTQEVTITQTEGTEKTEYRLYDFLANDSQYAMSDEVKQILASTALESPTLKIRMPDGSSVGEVVEEDGVFYIEAQNYEAGIHGMEWVPYTAVVMQEDMILTEAIFDGNVATWTEPGFTHVNVSYRLKIEKVKDGIVNRPIDEAEDILYALNLPHELVTQTVKQNELLGGDEGITAKVIFEKLNAASGMMTPDNLELLALCMETEEEKEAMLSLRMSEEKGGAWNTEKDELAIYQYLRMCDDSGWSLATYYESGIYKRVAEQSGILADCLEVITSAPGVWNMLELVPEYKPKMNKLVEMLPDLRELSQSIEGPHPAINVEDAEYETLIQQLIEMDGKTSELDTSDGVYAYASIRRNQADMGSLTIMVQINGTVAKTREIVYTMEGAEHVLTEEEANLIQKHLADMEQEYGLTAEEKEYYKEPFSAGEVKAGAKVGRNTIVSRVYYPREYVITLAGVPEYETSFIYVKNKNDYVITLPACPDEESYYCYWITENDENPIKVSNGIDGYYTFSKEDLTTLFVNGHYEIYKREQIEMLPAVYVKAEVIQDKTNIRGYKTQRVGSEDVYLYLDVRPNGLKIEDFKKLVSFTAENGEKLEVAEPDNSSLREPKNYEYLANGATVECIAYDKQKDPHETTFTIIILGDINKSGKIDINDAQLIGKNYLGTATEKEQIVDDLSKAASDVNMNFSYRDSNDAHLILKKIKYWSSTDETQKYESALAQ